MAKKLVYCSIANLNKEAKDNDKQIFTSQDHFIR